MRKVGALFWTVATVVVVALQAKAALAESSPPTIDMQARCRTSEKAMIEMMGDSSQRGLAFDTCMRAEKEAQAAIAKAWPDIPPSYKSFCIRKNDFSPSYIEWITCLEMMIDLKKTARIDRRAT